MKRIQALAPGVIGPGRTEIEVKPGVWINVVHPKSRAHERHAARIPQTRAWCMGADREYRQSIALSVRALIEDVHSPMDCSPVHARWNVIY